ncbi:MAG: hypothetical protein IKR04_03920 [Clostridia bacterium]|nr:hypothetical protein [Clostridia bacterium]
MKKIILLLIVFVLILIPTLALADMGEPSSVIYKGHISNKYGAIYYTLEDGAYVDVGTLPLGTTIIFRSTHGEKTPFIYERETFRSEKYIDRKDIAIDELYSYKLDVNKPARIFEDTDIFDMPLDIDDTDGHVIGKIPAQTDITVQEYVADDSLLNNGWSEWFYVSYDGVEGWIKNTRLAFKTEKSVITSRNFYSGDEILVPEYTAFDTYYQFAGDNYTTGVFYYSGEAYEFNTKGDIAYYIPEDERENYTFTIEFDDIELFDSTEAKEAVVKIPNGTTLSGDYITEGEVGIGWLCTTYNGVRGWLDCYTLNERTDEERLRNKKDLAQKYLEEYERENSLKNSANDKESYENTIPSTYIIIIASLIVVCILFIIIILIRKRR